MDSKEIIFLLGAGASFEAKIPVSRDMVNDVEDFVVNLPKWQPFKELYYYLKSSIQYSKGIFGEFDYQFNIEDLLVVLEALEQRDKSIMYPYIGNWNMRLVEFAGENFKNIINFKRLIKEQISEWVKPQEGGYENASYYSGFFEFQNEIGNTLKIFSLNYDLCFERTVERNQIDLNLEVGFSDRIWHYKNFDSLESESHGVHFALYKLHGSINWKKKNDTIYLEDDPVRDAELIFGVPYKLTSSDPYFFYSTEFRKSLLDPDSKIIICIGYSFYDDYLNRFISQALNEKDNMSLLSVTYCEEKHIEEKKDEISKKLLCDKNRIYVYNKGARFFLQSEMNVEKIESYLINSPESPFED